MRLFRPAIAGTVLALLASLCAITPASAGNPTSANDALTWLLAQQQPDGGFEMVNFPGFETPDAIQAIAASAQTGPTWSREQARAAVEAVDGGTDGATPLDWADDFVDGGVSAGLEAKIALLIALPLGFDPTNFDPEEDGATDLTDGLDGISLGLYNSFLFARLVEAVLEENVAQDDLQSICEAQHANGGWSFDAVPDGATPDDVDSSGFSTMALVAVGVRSDDPVVVAAVDYFEATQDQAGATPGGWFSFGELDPNATSIAVLAHRAAGGVIGDLGADPALFLASLQVTTPTDPPDDVVGRIESPADIFGVNSFPTSQAIQALLSLGGSPTWLPLPPAPGERICLPAHPFTDVATTAWNDNALRWLDHFSIANGFGGEFRPNGVFNRAQASIWFDALFPDVQGADNTFSDVGDGIWYENGADFVGDAGWPGGAIANGFPPDNKFRATDPFNRAQAVKWLHAAAGRPSVSGFDPHGFSDVDPWFADAVTWAKHHGLVNGFDDGTFRPYQQINRAQGAFWFYNLAASREAWGPTVLLPSTIVHSPQPDA